MDNTRKEQILARRNQDKLHRKNANDTLITTIIDWKTSGIWISNPYDPESIIGSNAFQMGFRKTKNITDETVASIKLLFDPRYFELTTRGNCIFITDIEEREEEKKINPYFYDIIPEIPNKITECWKNNKRYLKKGITQIIKRGVDVCVGLILGSIYHYIF